LSLPVAIKTVAFVLLSVGIIGIYLLLCGLTAWAAGATAGQVSRTLMLLLVPVAAAFHLAHHLPGAIGPNGPIAWYATVAILMAGHSLAAVIGGATVARLFAGARSTLVHRLLLAVPLAVLAMASLWILAQPLIAATGLG
jgi:hypothetical protein